MNKRCLLLFAETSVQKGLADPAALSELLNDTEVAIEVHWAYLEDLVFTIDNETIELYDARNGVAIEHYDTVYFRYWGAQEGHAIAAARICSLKGIPFIDRETLQIGSKNKITQYVNLHEVKVPIPRTLIANSQNLVSAYEKNGFSFPFIMKDKGGTRGQNNYLVRSHEQMEEIVATHPDVTFVLQEFIPNDGDYRVIVVGGTVRLVIERKANTGTHLNNTSQGGSAHIVPTNTLPEAVIQDCIRAAHFYGRDFAGVDIVRSTADDSYYCFEVNRAPQIDTASFEHEKAQILAEYLASVT